MKKLIAMTLIFLVNSAQCASSRDYIATCLAERSLIREKNLTLGRGFWIFKSSARKGCDYIEGVLRDMAEKEPVSARRGHTGYIGGVLEILTLAANQQKMKDAIKAVLPTADDETLKREFTYISDAADRARRR